LKLDKKFLKALFTEEEPFAENQWFNDLSGHEIIDLAGELFDRSTEGAAAFMKTSPAVLPFLSREEFLQWMILGQKTMKEPAQASGLCQEYFRSSPALLSAGSIHYLKGWVEQGLQMTEHSPLTAIYFFRSTPVFLKHGDIVHLRSWAGYAIQILAAGKSSEKAAVSFLKSSVEIIQFISFRELKDWHATGLKLAQHAADLASTYFTLIPEGLDVLYPSERLTVFQLVSILTQACPEKAIEFYERCPTALLTLSPTVRAAALETTRTLSSEQPGGIPSAFDAIVSSIASLSYPAQDKVMTYEAALGKISIQASWTYLKNISRVLEEMPEVFLDHWIEKGLSFLLQDEQAGISYFTLISQESCHELLRWKEAVLLEDHRRLLAIFAHALAGQKLRLKSTEELDSDEKPIVRHYPTGDGQTIYLPPFIASEQTRKENFREYKVAAAHQAGYIEFGTFKSGLTSILTVLEFFPLKKLAEDIFFILEDGRIDRMLMQEYAGLRQEIELVFSRTMSRRPFFKDLPFQEALVEVLLRLTIGCLDETEIPPAVLKHVAFLKDTLSGFYEKARGVWDCFFKTLTIYEYLSRLPASRSYIPSVPLFFRGRLDPELLPGSGPWKAPPDEIINDGLDSEGVIPMSMDELKEFLKTVDPSKLKFLEAKEPFSQGLFITDADEIRAKSASNDQNAEDYDEQEHPIVSIFNRSTGQEGPFYYDEWDYLAKAYRPRWCCLRERVVEPFESERIDEIYANYNDLIQKVKKQFQRIRPNVIEVVRRVEWGDEIDLPPMIEAVVDRRASASPSDRIFSRRDKKIRKISTLLLIDMSASTDELVPYIEKYSNSGTELAREPALHKMASKDKKIIDIEIESLVVIMEALNALDDDYAIFGFSGYGRECVDFYRIKDFSDSYTETMKKRIGGIQPKQSTRMGPAIRHAIEKLKPIESDQRLLILLSDGFPQDHDYGEDRRSNEYGLHDTMLALLEAKKKGIQPFCITVDQSGNDYLRKMCDPRSYLVIQDIHSLPEILPRVIESLMM